MKMMVLSLKVHFENLQVEESGNWFLLVVATCNLGMNKLQYADKRYTSSGYKWKASTSLAIQFILNFTVNDLVEIIVYKQGYYYSTLMSTTADVVESTVSISLTPLMKMDGLDVYVDGEVGEANLLNDTGDLIWYLEKELGPQSQELYKAVPITVIYAAIFVTGIVGNVATCVVIARNRYMQTATNCYLFNLAVSDLLMLVAGLPQVMLIYVQQDE